MLKTRVITACVLLLVFIPVLFLTSPIFLYLLLSIFISLAAWEWGRLIWGVKKVWYSYFYAILTQIILLWLSIELFYFSDGVDVIVSQLLKMSLWISSLFWVMIVPLIMRQQLRFPLQKYATSLAIVGCIIFIADWYAIVMLRNDGLWVLLSVLMLVWAADIGAYVFGKQFGKRKLAIQLSPGKSVEGAVGGMFCVGLLAVFFVYFSQGFDNFFSHISNHLSIGIVIGIILLLTCMSIIGDLFESQLKRLSGVKDSSGLLPGHGGVLDRLDALLPVLPLAALILQSSK